MAEETEEYRRLVRAIKEASDASAARFEKEKAQAEVIKELYKERIGFEGDLKEVIAQNNNILEAEARAARAKFEERIRFQVEYQYNLEQEQKLLNEIRKLGDDIRAAEARGHRAERKTIVEIIKLKQNKLEEVKTELKAQKQIRRSIKTNVEELQRQADSTSDVADANKGLQSSLRSVLKTTTGLTGEVGGLTEAFVKFNNIDPTQQKKILNNLNMTVKETFNPLAIADNLLNKIGQSTFMFMKEFDKLAADFRKNTGIIDKGFGGIEQRIVNVQRANLRMGVSMDEAFKAANSLTAEMASFTSMTDDAQATVLQAATVLQEFGVGAQTTAQIFNNFSKGLGFNAQQLEKLSTQLMAISTSLRIPPQIIATEFNAASKELMKYGANMVNVFEGIAEQSKQTGIAMGELLGIVKQFDTFEDAGAAVGKLNAILGGPYLNAINMVYATEEERIKQLRQSIQLSGRQFNQLSRFEQQAIATAAGISDMTVAARLFGGTNSEFAKTEMSMKEMQERAAKAQSVQEKFTQVMQSFAIALGPVVYVLGDLLEGLVIILNPFTELIDLGNEFGGTANVVANGVYLIVGSLVLLKKEIIAIKAQTAMMFAGFASLVAGFLLFKNIIEDLEGPLKIFITLLGIAAAVAAVATIVASGGLAAAPIFAGLQLLGIGAGLGTIAAIPSFEDGKEKGTSVRGGKGLISEAGPEAFMKADGSAYLAASPSIIELDTQDTVYSNAETKAMLNGGEGSRDNSAELAVIRQQQQDAAQDRALIQQTLDAVMTVASRPIELNGKKVFEGQLPQLNRALGLSRRGTLT